MFRVNLLQPEIDYTTRKVIARFEVNEGNYREFYDIADKEKEFDLSITKVDPEGFDGVPLSRWVES